MGIKEKPKQQLINEQEEISPLSILIGLFILSLFSFLIVDLLPTIFYRALDASSYLAFHNFTEIFSIIVSFSIAGVGWYTYDQSRNRHTLFLSCAFIAVGLLDIMHTLSYPGMPKISRERLLLRGGALGYQLLPLRESVISSCRVIP
ncbi:MAG TPA: MASE3 domain-containing protein [Candidatus Methanoperedens sp.]